MYNSFKIYFYRNDEHIYTNQKTFYDCNIFKSDVSYSNMFIKRMLSNLKLKQEFVNFLKKNGWPNKVFNAGKCFLEQEFADNKEYVRKFWPEKINNPVFTSGSPSKFKDMRTWDIPFASLLKHTDIVYIYNANKETLKIITKDDEEISIPTGSLAVFYKNKLDGVYCDGKSITVTKRMVISMSTIKTVFGRNIFV